MYERIGKKSKLGKLPNYQLKSPNLARIYPKIFLNQFFHR